MPLSTSDQTLPPLELDSCGSTAAYPHRSTRADGCGGHPQHGQHGNFFQQHSIVSSSVSASVPHRRSSLPRTHLKVMIVGCRTNQPKNSYSAKMYMYARNVWKPSPHPPDSSMTCTKETAHASETAEKPRQVRK